MSNLKRKCFVLIGVSQLLKNTREATRCLVSDRSHRDATLSGPICRTGIQRGKMSQNHGLNVLTVRRGGRSKIVRNSDSTRMCEVT